MKDNEIIKALECCIAKENCEEISCEKCPLERCSDCKEVMFQKALDLINRQKAEIERLEVKVKTLKAVINYNERQSKTAKSEAIKEFAERLKPKLKSGEILLDTAIQNNIDTLVAEMMEQKG